MSMPCIFSASMRMAPSGTSTSWPSTVIFTIFTGCVVLIVSSPGGVGGGGGARAPRSGSSGAAGSAAAGLGPRRLAQELLAAVERAREVLGELLHRARDRPDGRVAERAVRFAFDVLAKRSDQLEVLGAAAADRDALEDLL